MRRRAGGIARRRTGGIARRRAGGIMRRRAGGIARRRAGGIMRRRAGGIMRRRAGGIARRRAGGIMRRRAGCSMRRRPWGVMRWGGTTVRRNSAGLPRPMVDSAMRERNEILDIHRRVNPVRPTCIAIGAIDETRDVRVRQMVDANAAVDRNGRDTIGIRERPAMHGRNELDRALSEQPSMRLRPITCSFVVDAQDVMP